MNYKAFRNICIFFILTLLPLFASGQTQVGGGIYENTTWSREGSPYLVSGNTVVFQGSTLTVEPGVIVKFNNGVNLRIQGTLTAIGSKTDSITFTTSKTTPSKSSWQNIYIEYEGKFMFEYVKLEHSDEGLLFSHLLNAQDCYIKHSRFFNNNMAMTRGGGGTSGISIDSTLFHYNNKGMREWFSHMVITNSSFINNGTGAFIADSFVDNCIFLNNSDRGLSGFTSIIQNCQFINNNVGLEQSFSGGSSASTMTGNIIRNNIIGLRITGNSPRAIFSNNTLCENSQYNVENTSTYSGHDLSNNRWCTSNSQLIAQSILDGADDINRGLVIYTPLWNDGLEITLPDTIPICGGAPVLVSAGNEELNPSYSWKLLPDGPIVSESSTMETAIQGDYELIVSTNGGTVSDTVSLINYPSPSADFLIAEECFQSDIVDIRYDDLLTEGLTLKWDLAGGEIMENQKDSLLKVSWPSFGVKEIVLETVRNGCTSRSSKSINVIKKVTSTFSIPAFVCEGNYALIEYQGNGADTASYNWDFDGGEIISGSGSGPYEVLWNTFGAKNVSLSVHENGSSETSTKTIHYNPYILISVEAGEPTICNNEEYLVKIEVDNYTGISWDFDGATILSGSGTGPYFLKWDSPGDKMIHVMVEDNGCATDATIPVKVTPPPAVPEICKVTVDEESGKNSLFWSYEEAASQFGIYRETNVVGEFTLVEYVEGGLLNNYLDQQSSPEHQSNRYKITAVDSCGTETIKSSAHKSIHLDVDQGESKSLLLKWNGYEGFSLSTYRIFRSLAGSDFELLAEVASNLSNYTDQDINSAEVRYQIEVLKPGICGEEQSVSVEDNTLIRSNIVRSSNLTGLKVPDENKIIYSNPVENILYLNVEDDIGVQFYLLTLEGKEVKRGDFEKSLQIDMSDKAPGIYILKLETTKGSITKKVVKM